MESIISNINQINKCIEATCLKVGRNPREVKLLLATKTVPVEKIKVALLHEQIIIAENKVQEVKEKYEGLKNIPHINHFIGHLQTNKIKELIKYDVSCIHSLDRLELAEKLQHQLVLEDKRMEVFLQVNTSYEESKFGIDPQEVLTLIHQIASFDRLEIKGLMTIGLFSAEKEKVRKCFRLLKEIQQKIKAENIPNVSMDELSMGMSNDLETAIEEGATIIRVGTAIFGTRKYSNNYYWNEHK